MVALIAVFACAVAGLVMVESRGSGPKSPWVLMGGAAAASALHLVLTAGGAPAEVAVTAQLSAYLFASAGLWRLRKLRNAESDGSNRFDALIVAGSYGIAVAGLVIGETKFAEALLCGAGVVVVFEFVRLALAAGHRRASFWLLSMIPAALLFGDLARVALDDTFTGSAILLFIVPTLGLIAGTSAALHESASQLTSSVESVPARMTARRFAIIAIAVSAPVATMLVENVDSDAWRILPMAMLATITVLRFIRLIRARETSGQVDVIVNRASAEFTNATTRDEIHDIALRASVEIISLARPQPVVSLFMIDKRSWQQVATTRSGNDGLRGQARIKTIVQSLLSKDAADTSLRSLRQFELMDRHFVMAPLVSQNELRGSLIAEVSGPVPADVAAAFGHLTTQLSLVLEAASTTKELNELLGMRRFMALIENSNDAVFITDTSGQPSFASPAGESILKASGQSVSVFQAIHPRDRAAFVSMVQNAPQSMRALDKQQRVECRVANNRELEQWIEATATDMTQDPDIGGIVITAHDVTERKMLENDIRHRVLHDETTGIANRALLKERVDHALSMRRSDDSVAALLFVNIDDFKIINERLGRQAGDDILKVIAFRIENFVRGHDTPARLEADTFAVLLQDVASSQDIDTVAKRLAKVVQRPVDFDGREIEIKARIGVCVARPDYDSGVFLRNAEVALHEAKEATGRIAYFTESMSVSAVERLGLRRDLERAIDRQEFVLYYQPVMDLQAQSIAGFEALLRWEHPERGLVSPASFIPLAEESGLIMRIGEWAVQEAFSQLATWRMMRPDLHLQMSVNVSPRQLMDHEFVETVDYIIRNSELDASSLVLELTAADQLAEAAVRERLSQLKALGVGIAADDFGSGFASYSALQELPFTVAKIDRSLVIGLESNVEKATRQLLAVIEMAHSANLRVGAEGIEDEHQRQLLTNLGCDLGQGYFFGRPIAASEAQQQFIMRAPSARFGG